MLAFNTGGFTAVLNKLRTNLIINTDADYCPKLKSNSYYLINRYGKIYNKSTDFQLFYNSENCDVPVWVQKYCGDAGVVKNAKFSNYKKSKSAKDAEIERLNNEVKRLQDLLKLNNIQDAEISPLEPTRAADEVVVEEVEKPTVTSSYDANSDTFKLTANGKDFTFQNYSVLTKQIVLEEKQKVAIHKIVNNECDDCVMVGKAVYFSKSETSGLVNIKFTP